MAVFIIGVLFGSFLMTVLCMRFVVRMIISLVMISNWLSCLVSGSSICGLWSKFSEVLKMRRFLLSLFFVGALSAVFSFTAFANWTDPVSSAYMGSGQATYNHTVTYNISANPGDVWYFDVGFTWYGETIYNPSNQNITAQVYNRTFDKSASLVALGSNYGAADVSTEGNRVWLVFNQSVSSVTVTLQIEYSLSWQSGTFNGSPVQDLSNCIATMACNANCGTINRSKYGLPSISSNSAKLDQILSSLGKSGSTIDFLGPDAIAYFDNRYIDSIYVKDGSFGWTTDGYLSFTNVTQPFALYSHPTSSIAFLSKGSYYFVFNSSCWITSFSLVSGSSDAYTVEKYSQYTVRTSNLTVFVVTVNKAISFNEITFIPEGNLSGIFYGGIVPIPADDLAGSAINPDQDGMVSDVDDAGEQQSQQEDQMWQNINTYKGDISFNLDGWDDAAGGLSYVTGVFMTIWNNSPTQPIVLSLMLGIAMLSIGRGVMAAVRVSRNKGDD